MHKECTCSQRGTFGNVGNHIESGKWRRRSWLARRGWWESSNLLHVVACRRKVGLIIGSPYIEKCVRGSAMYHGRVRGASGFWHSHYRTPSPGRNAAACPLYDVHDSSTAFTPAARVSRAPAADAPEDRSGSRNGQTSWLRAGNWSF